MKQRMLLAGSFLLAFLLYPAFIIPGFRPGYYVSFNALQAVFLSAFFALGTVAFWVLFRKRAMKTEATLPESLLYSLGSLLYLGNVVLFLWVGLIENHLWTLAPLLIPAPLIVYLLLEYALPRWLRYITFVLDLVLAGGLSLLLLITVFFALFPFTSDTILRNVDSPNGTYCAILFSHNAGATGGSTEVSIREQGKDVQMGLCTYKKRPKYIYVGGWGLKDSVTMEWLDDETILINGTPYDAKNP